MAQLGARFHGMEEVVSSNLTRSTKTFQTLTANTQLEERPPESKRHFDHGQPGPLCGISILPTGAVTNLFVQELGRHGHRFTRLLSSSEDDNIWFPYRDDVRRAHAVVPCFEFRAARGA